MPAPMSNAVKYSTPEYHDVIAIGAGVTSLALACQLQMLIGQKDFILLEREGGLGGTWYSNSYPASGCGELYGTILMRNWSSFFALQDEIQSYLQETADRFDVTRKCRFKTEVITSQWDDKLGLWHLYTRPAKGSTERGGENKHYVCKVLFCGLGGLSQPNKCNIDGAENFKGPIFHSARWDHSVNMSGKDVFVVGNGCSATQFIPQIAKEAKSVKQAVRSRHWYAERPGDITDYRIWKWALRYLPGFWRIQRLIIFVVLELSMLMMKRNFIGKLMRDHFANSCIKYARETAPKKYHDMLLPDPKVLPPGAKRRVFDTGYLPCLHRDNVDLVTSKTTKITEKSVVTEDGEEHPADVIVLANGFATTEMGFPMKIEGKNGVTMQEHWKKNGGPQCYRGCMMSEFPNFFLGMGANSGTGHFSYIFTAECTTRFAIYVMKPILETPRPFIFDHKSPFAKRGPTFCVKPSAETEEQVWTQWLSSKMVYTYESAGWYLDKETGRSVSMYPSWQVVFWLRACNPMYTDINYTKCTPPNGVLTRLRQWVGIGATPNMSSHYDAFERGEYTVGKKPQIKQIT